MSQYERMSVLLKPTKVSPAKVLAGAAELGHMAQVAVGTKNVPLASAVLSLLDKMPSKDRPVGPAELAVAMKLED